MVKILSKTLRIAGRVYERLIPDEETAREIGRRYARMYNPEVFKRP